MSNKTVHSKLKQYIEDNGWGQKPIFNILVFEKPDEEFLHNGKRSGWPDMGAQNNVGFYYEFETAYQAIRENWCDIHETIYDAAFLLCRFPGLYDTVGSEGRIYFIWDKNRREYVEADEPEIFRHIAL